MEIKEYNNEVQWLKNELKKHKDAIRSFKIDTKIVEELLKHEKSNTKLLRLKTMLVSRNNFNNEIIEQLTFALNYLKTEKTMDDMYNNYLLTYRNKLKSFKELTESEEFISLASEYFEDVNCGLNV